jgi:hypothetical protein
MATIKLVCTRKVENTNLTFGTGKLGALTLTGEIYDCEGYRARYVDENGIQHFGDLSTQLVGCVGTVAFEGTLEEYEAIQTKVAKYFQRKAERNVHAIKIGIILESSPKLSKSQWDGEYRETYILNEAEFIGVETPDLTEDAEDIVVESNAARSNAKERKTTGLANYLSNKLSQVKQAVADNLLDPDANEILKANKTTATTTKAKTKVNK